MSENDIVEWMLTTTDNPFNPFTEFDKWFQFDIANNYNTSAYLGRIANTSIYLPENINRLEINKAINEICDLNLLGIYKKVQRTDFE